MIYAPIDEIVRAIGLPAALKLAEEFGGTRVYLPHPSRVKPETPAARAIGLEAACALAAEWPQCEVMIPRAAELLRRARDAAIVAESGSASVRELARKYGLTGRRIQQIRADATEDDPAGAESAQRAG